MPCIPWLRITVSTFAAGACGHIVATADQLGWSTVTNGDLIRLAEQEGFELLLTTDLQGR